MDAAPEVQSARRWAKLIERRRRQRRLVAALLAVVGTSAIVAAVTFNPAPDTPPASAGTAGSAPDPATTTPSEGGGTPATAPGGVGENPTKTGLPPVPATGGKVRTGTERHCFDTVAEYLEQWHRTGVEPDPCFRPQPASNQDQPDGVQRTYNGEQF